MKHVQIAQYGNQLTGHFEGPDQSGPIQGEINGHHIRFSTVTRNVLNFGGKSTASDVRVDTGFTASMQLGRPCGRPPVAAVETPATGTVYASQPVIAPPAPAAAPEPQLTSQPGRFRHDRQLRANTGAPVIGSTRCPGCSHRAVPRCAGGTGARRFYESRPGRIRRRLAGTKQEPYWSSTRAGHRPATLGPQHQGFDAVSFRAGQPGA